MHLYKNLQGDSGIAAYEITEKAILVRFKSSVTYLYDYATTGKARVERMKALARGGKGLGTFISQHVHDRYAKKLG